MENLIKQVEFLAAEEYGHASQLYGPQCSSAHEGYAVLKEECDEAHDEVIALDLFTDRFWKSVKTNDTDSQLENLEAIYKKSILAACEYIQTAAMALKTARTVAPTKPLKTLTGGD